MNRLSTLCLVAMAALSGTPMAWADDAQNAPSTSPTSVEKRNAVLGQPGTPPPSSNDASQQREQPSSPAGADARKAREAQALYE